MIPVIFATLIIAAYYFGHMAGSHDAKLRINQVILHSFKYDRAAYIRFYKEITKEMPFEQHREFIRLAEKEFDRYHGNDQ